MSDIFGHHPWTVRELVDGLDSGSIRLPDLQRPFVWSNAKVRDLVDSMYQGFPVGQLMFWKQTDPRHASQIGVGEKTQDSSFQVIDGQQRLTSLYAVIKGATILREDYAEERIVISFNPLTRRFAVPDGGTRRSADWIQDIRGVFVDPIEARRSFVTAQEKTRNVPRLDSDLEAEIERAINRLHHVLSYQFQAVQLGEDVGRESVADIFVRINSEGVKLGNPDFILTWLSVFWEEGREEIEQFARASRFSAKELSRMEGQKVVWTPQNAYIELDPNHVLRVAVAVGNRRARLGDAYNSLRGRDPRTREIRPELRETELSKLKVGVGLATEPSNWDAYLKVVERAGIRSTSMVPSKNLVTYGYAIWLLGKTEFGVPLDELRELMAQWYFMAHVSRRYTGSSETQVQSDINRLEDLERTPQAFIHEIKSQIETVLTTDWWEVQLPEDFHTSSTSGPAFTAYLAALIILDADVLLSNLKVRDWLDPSRRPVRGIEKHHLFPRAYLRDALKVTSNRQINQAANQALVEWLDNLKISDQAPAQYWAEQVAAKGLGADKLKEQMWWHASPDGWVDMDYGQFLQARRKRMASVTREGFKKLSDPNYVPTPPSPKSEAQRKVLPTLSELVQSGAIEAGSQLEQTGGFTRSVAEVNSDGTILLRDVEYRTPDQAALADADEEVDGWEYWTVRPSGNTLAEIREAAGLSAR